MTETVAYVSPLDGGGWRIEGTRVSLDSVVHAYLEGRLPESIVDSFPSLSLEQVHGAIAFYLRNREAVERHLAQQAERWEELRRDSEARNAPLLERIRAARANEEAA